MMKKSNFNLLPQSTWFVLKKWFNTLIAGRNRRDDDFNHPYLIY
jgi:hypothetical protein